MITKYEKFIKESDNIKWKKTDPEYYGITKYKWNGKYLDCDQDVNLHNGEDKKNKLNKLPFLFGKINGDFDCSKNLLTDLEGSPLEITGNFDCGYNVITDLKKGPKIVGRYYYCETNKITSLEGSPEEINGDFDCYDNKLESYQFCPKLIKGSFSANKNSVVNIDEYPLSIIEGFIHTPIFNDQLIKNTILSNRDIFKPLLDDKKAFHQMLMRLNPEIIPRYINSDIPTPSKKTIL